MNSRIGLFVFLAAAAGACSHESAESRPVGVTNTQPDGNDASLARIAEARCDHAAACEEVGQDKRFASRDACVSETMTGVRASLNQSACPRGIDQNQSKECVSALHASSCQKRIDSLDALASCQTSLLCSR